MDRPFQNNSEAKALPRRAADRGENPRRRFSDPVLLGPYRALGWVGQAAFWLFVLVLCSLICPLLGGPLTIVVWTTEESLDGWAEAQA